MFFDHSYCLSQTSPGRIPTPPRDIVQYIILLFSLAKGQPKFIIMSSGYVFVLFLAGVNIFSMVVVGCKGYPSLCVNNVQINISTHRHQGHVMFS